MNNLDSRPQIGAQYFQKMLNYNGGRLITNTTYFLCCYLYQVLMRGIVRFEKLQFVNHFPHIGLVFRQGNNHLHCLIVNFHILRQTYIPQFHNHIRLINFTEIHNLTAGLYPRYNILDVITGKEEARRVGILLNEPLQGQLRNYGHIVALIQNDNFESVV